MKQRAPRNVSIPKPSCSLWSSQVSLLLDPSNPWAPEPTALGISKTTFQLPALGPVSLLTLRPATPPPSPPTLSRDPGALHLTEAEAPCALSNGSWKTPFQIASTNQSTAAILCRPSPPPPAKPNGRSHKIVSDLNSVWERSKEIVPSILPKAQTHKLAKLRAWLSDVVMPADRRDHARLSTAPLLPPLLAN